jgi:hypothetical protein
VIVQTSTGRDIPNFQETEISDLNRRQLRGLLQEFTSRVKIRRGMSPTYNCHGLTFASRRAWVIDADAIQQILADDRFREIERKDSLPGDILVYRDTTGDLTHSGVVVENGGPFYVPIVFSKWGAGPELIHNYLDVPGVYGRDIRFYRCEV